MAPNPEWGGATCVAKCEIKKWKKKVFRYNVQAQEMKLIKVLFFGLRGPPKWGKASCKAKSETKQAGDSYWYEGLDSL
jgi:hypothetical protein